jgi:predicted enzyme related to lactoylglutathione lyase
VSSRPVHFDLTAEDPDRLAAFYGRVFGWTLQKWDGPNEYWMLTTGSDGELGINGGIWRRTARMSPQTVNTMSVDSIDSSIQALESAGGRVTVPKMEIPGVGIWAQAVDTEGNTFGLMQFTQHGHSH